MNTKEAPMLSGPLLSYLQKTCWVLSGDHELVHQAVQVGAVTIQLR
jgi:hypothetical protein